MNDSSFERERPTLSTIESRTFLDDGKTAVNGLRRALAEVLGSVQADPDEPQELSRRFGLDKTLTWRIARVVREEDAWEAVQHIPRRPSIQIFASAMAKHGAARESVESLWKALDVFESFVETHSGDRETLEMMASSAARKSASKRLEAFRKSGFQANSAVWGVSAKVQLGLKYMIPGRNPGFVTLATICGLVDFRRLRAHTPWAMASIHSWRAAGTNDTEEYRQRVMPMVADPSNPSSILLPHFCSSPLAEIRILENPPGTMRHMLAEGPVGNTAAATVYMGWTIEDCAPTHQTIPDETGDHIVLLSTPVEELIHDIYIHKDLAFAMNPTAHVYSQLPGGPQYPSAGPDAPQLPMPVEVIDLGVPTQVVTPEVPGYHEISEFGAQSIGCALTDFRAFRYRLRYPPIPTMSILRHALLPGR